MKMITDMVPAPIVPFCSSDSGSRMMVGILYSLWGTGELTVFLLGRDSRTTGGTLGKRGPLVMVGPAIDASCFP